MFCIETQFEITKAVDQVDDLSDVYSFQTTLTVAVVKQGNTAEINISYVNALDQDPFSDSRIMVIDRQDAVLAQAATLLNSVEIEFLRQFTQAAANQRESVYFEWYQWLLVLKDCA